jgi:cytidine deaminase
MPGRKPKTNGPGPADRALIRSAVVLLKRRYDQERHTVAAAVRVASGRIYTGVNLNGIHTPCAEPVALGAALSEGETEVRTMVAVHRRGRRYSVLAPCGTCRQMLFDYAPRAHVLLPRGTRVVRMRIAEALPLAYSTFDAA